MKYYLLEGLFIVTLLLAGYMLGKATVNHRPTTSRQLLVLAEASCAKEPEVDMQRIYCTNARVAEACMLDGYDLKVCGMVDNHR